MAGRVVRPIYENGKPVGLHRVFSEDGRVLYETTFPPLQSTDGVKKPGLGGEDKEKDNRTVWRLSAVVVGWL